MMKNYLTGTTSVIPVVRYTKSPDFTTAQHMHVTKSHLYTTNLYKNKFKKPYSLTFELESSVNTYFILKKNTHRLPKVPMIN